MLETVQEVQPEPPKENTRIFKYNNGFADVWEDPFEIEFRVQKAQEFEDMQTLEKWISGIRNEDGEIDKNADENAWKLYLEACHRMIPIIRKGFSLKEFDTSTGQGMTGEEVLDLYASFLEWRNGLKKNT